MADPDFNALRAARNAQFTERMQEIADDLGVPLSTLNTSFNPNRCYCACSSGGPCEHSWDGPEWVSEDQCSQSVTCSKCGVTAMSHDMRNF